MARQSSFIKLEGTIGDVTFYKGKNGYNARQKGGVPKSRIMNDPSFQRTRENLAEFARAATSSKFLKDAFREITLRSRDLRTHNRLYSTALRVIKSDPTSKRGERIIANGDITIFNGFQFSYNAMWESTVFVPFTVDNGTSDVTVNLNDFVPSKMLANPQGATHFRLFLVNAAVDFTEEVYRSQSIVGPEMPINITPVTGFSLALTKLGLAGHTDFYAIGVEFLQEVNGDFYDLNDRAHNAARIILID